MIKLWDTSLFKSNYENIEPYYTLRGIIIIIKS